MSTREMQKIREWVRVITTLRVITTQMEIHVWCKIIHVYGKSTVLLNRHRQTDKPKDKYWIPSMMPTSEDKWNFWLNYHKCTHVSSSLTEMHSKKALGRFLALQMSTILHKNICPSSKSGYSVNRSSTKETQ